MKRFLDREKNILITDTDYIHGSLTAEGNNFIDKTRITGSVRLGFFSYIGRYSEVNNSTIGRYCSIAPRVIIGAPEHPTEEFSSHLITYSDKGPFGYIKDLSKWFCGSSFDDKKTTTIGNDVWIGDSAFIKRGITIGDGAIIGARAIITKDVAPYSIVTSDNNRIIRNRFTSHETIAKIEKSKWWEYDLSEISGVLMEAKSPDTRIKTILNNIKHLRKLDIKETRVSKDRTTGSIEQH
ncbi:Acetyltransferase (isoleucine patch superfamily) [Aeromonas sp. RU39B]|nr:CatB-related O-acetyltransferase [Aeromonas sp. RU39B]SIR65014.1 Acetyltransferase (isoleucine patch superfamily) [Aeromonas sp. RU39B]